MKKIVIMVLSILIIGSAGWYGITKAFTAPNSLLPEENVSQMIKQKYGGNIETISVVQENEKLNYSLKLIKDQIPYQVIVNGQTGEVLSMTKQTTEQKPEVLPAVPKEKQQEPITNPSKNNQSNTFSSNTLQTVITIDQAKGIALEKVNGTINSVELDEEDGQLVYEVEIKQSQTKEAEVIINPYSGKVESITIDTDTDD